MELSDFLYASNFRVFESSGYGWDCFPDGQLMSVTDIDDNEVGSCVFSRKDQAVYELQVSIDEDQVVYRWIDPNWLKISQDEHTKRGVDINLAYDNVFYTDVDSEKEILSLLRNVVHKTYVHSHNLPEEGVTAKPKKAKKSKSSKKKK